MDHNSKISLNVHLQVPSTTSQDGSHTPNTPEILNTIVNMTAGPFAPDFFRSSNHHHQMAPPPTQSTYTSTSSSTSTIATATRAASISAMAPPVTASQLSPIAEENPVYNIASVRIIYSQYALYDRAVVRGRGGDSAPLEILDFRKEDGKRNKQSIIDYMCISPPQIWKPNDSSERCLFSKFINK